jgi:hypothetical protein
MFCEDLLGRVSSQPLMTVSEDLKRSLKCLKCPKYNIRRSEESESVNNTKVEFGEYELWYMELRSMSD